MARPGRTYLLAKLLRPAKRLPTRDLDVFLQLLAPGAVHDISKRPLGRCLRAMFTRLTAEKDAGILAIARLDGENKAK